MTEKIDIGAFVQGSPHPTWLAHSDGRCVYANPILTRLTGLSSTQLKQTHWLELVTDEDRPTARVAWQHSQFGGTPLHVVGVCLRSVDPENSTPVKLIAFRHNPTDGGELWLFTALYLHASTQQHPPLEAQLQATLNVIPIQAWYATPSGVLIFVNEAAAAYMGLPQPHHLRFGMDVGGTLDSHLAFVHPEDRAHTRRKWAACLRMHEAGEVRFRVLGASGIYRWFLTRAETLRARDGALLYWVGVNVDIDDEKRAFEVLNAAKERIAHATQLATVAELSASIAHEVVQPLSAVVANARASLNWLSGEQPNIVQARAAIEGVLRDGMSVGNVIHEMRRLFKKETPNKKTIQLNYLIEQVVEVLGADLRNKEITVALDLLPDLPATEADAVQIQQVLLNLIQNASEALDAQSPHSKELTIRTKCSDLGVTVEVEDNGTGVPDPERIFEAFFTTKEEGLGVGLSISRSIAEAHGGTLTASDREGGGARFNLTLPRRP
jgi:signal transduction histidine kinase